MTLSKHFLNWRLDDSKSWGSFRRDVWQKDMTVRLTAVKSAELMLCEKWCWKSEAEQLRGTATCTTWLWAACTYVLTVNVLLFVERCPQSHPEDQLSHVQPGPHSHLHLTLPRLHWVRNSSGLTPHCLTDHGCNVLQIKLHFYDHPAVPLNTHLWFNLYSGLSGWSHWDRDLFRRYLANTFFVCTFLYIFDLLTTSRISIPPDISSKYRVCCYFRRWLWLWQKP